jgi:MFS family permease
MCSATSWKRPDAPRLTPHPPPPTGRRAAAHTTIPTSSTSGPFRVAGVCILASVMAILDTTAVAVAQRTFIVQFGSTQAVVARTMTGHTLAVATVIPITGWAADRFGTKRLFMGAVFAFTLGSLPCSLAPTILLLIMFRVLQGIGGGLLQQVGIMILTREAGPKRLGRLMAVGFPC